MKQYKEIDFKGLSSERTIWKNEFGEYHREDGPAEIWKDGHKRWWLNDVEYYEKDYNQELYNRNLKKLNETN